MAHLYRGGRYEVLETLGQGGTASVYRARDLVDGRTVALKVLAPGADATPSPLDRSEFRLLASQSHPHVVRVFDHGRTADGLGYFTLELIEGEDLLTFARRQPSSSAGADLLWDLLRQLFEALAYLHARRVLHLDLKPANILVTTAKDGRATVKLIDFGLARGEAASSTIVGGTAEYLAPERIRGEAPDARSDLYSVGVIIHELFAGAPPYTGATVAEVLSAHLDAPLPDGARLPERARKLVLRLLEKTPSLRPASARAILQEYFGAADELEMPLLGVAFVGREEILAQLDRAAREARDGSPRTLFLRGSAGVGKSRLLRELEVRLQLDGFAAGVEVCLAGASRAGESLLRLVRRAVLDTEPAARALALELSRLQNLDASGDATELEARRDRIPGQAVNSILAAARRGPLAILVDDVQLADTLSREALLRLVRAADAAGDCKLLLVLVGNDESSDLLDEIERALKSSASARLARVSGLTEQEVRRFVAEVLGDGALSEESAKALSDATGGNVFYLEEHLKHLISSGKLRPTDRGWELISADGTLDVPSSVEGVIARRLEMLHAPVKHVLEWASVWERPVSCDELTPLVAAPAEEVERMLAALTLQQLLVRDGARYSFAHASLRSVAYSSIAEERRRSMHAGIARCLAKEPERVEEIAHHLYHAGKLGEARAHLRRAGDRARSSGSLREATLHYTRALEAEDAPRERFDLLVARQETLGFLGRKEAQREDLSALRALATAMGEEQLEREAELREALYLESLGKKREALERLQLALGKCRSDPAAAARLRSRAAMLHFYLAELETGFELIDRALDHARSHGDRGLEAECLQVRGLGNLLRTDPARAVEDMSLALAIRREEGDETRAASLESNLGLIYLERGELEAAEERFRASLKLFRRVGLRRGEAVNLLNLGLVAVELGRFEPALDSFHAALRLRRELGDRRGEGADLGNLAGAWIQIGRYERAVPLLDQAIRIAGEHENRSSASANESRRGQIALERGEPARALEQYERALDLARQARSVPQEVLAHLGLARARLGLADADGAEVAARAAVKLVEGGGPRARLILAQSVWSAALLAQGQHAEAEKISSAVVETLQRLSGTWAEAHAVWFGRYQILATQPFEARGGDTASEQALRRAYTLLRERADAFQDDELRQGYLENVPLHREICRLHEELQTRNRREATRRERSFHEIARSLHSITEIDPLLERLLELAIETTHGEKGLITLKNKDGGFTIRAARGMAKESVEDAAEICRSVIDDVARGGEPVLAVDAGADERFRERRSIVSFRIHTLLCVPMKVRDEIIGAVYVDGRGASSFNREDLEYLVSFAQLAAIAVENARLMDRLRAENLYLRREVETRYRFENLIGQSPAMAQLTRLMEKVASTHACVFVSGETGTGKEVIARAIHYASNRRSQPFVAVDCGALPENLLESELFGHRRGAFSGAIHDRVGLFEEADGGTIFLDEITNTSLELQAKLLRVLQESEVRRVGENQMRKVDVRVIAASNVDVRGAVDRGTFRQDLYYRLNVVSLEVPPLRERREDIPILALHFLKRSCERHQKRVVGFTEEAMTLLAQAPWRGNVRELENLIEKAVILTDAERLDAEFLGGLLPRAAGPSALPTPSVALPGPATTLAEDFADLTLEAFDERWLGAERAYLEHLVKSARGNLAEAVRQAKCRNRNTLISRLKRHGIGRE